MEIYKIKHVLPSQIVWAAQAARTGPPRRWQPPHPAMAPSSWPTLAALLLCASFIHYECEILVIIAVLAGLNLNATKWPIHYT